MLATTVSVYAINLSSPHWLNKCIIVCTHLYAKTSLYLCRNWESINRQVKCIKSIIRRKRPLLIHKFNRCVCVWIFKTIYIQWWNAEWNLKMTRKGRPRKKRPYNSLFPLSLKWLHLENVLEEFAMCSLLSQCESMRQLWINNLRERNLFIRKWRPINTDFFD